MSASVASVDLAAAVVAEFVAAVTGHMGASLSPLDRSVAFRACLVAFFFDESECLLVFFRGTCAIAIVLKSTT